MSLEQVSLRVAEALGRPGDAAAADELAARIGPPVAEVRHRWPRAPEPGPAFAAHLVERLVKQPDPADALARMRLDELYLAWWAGTGDDAGIAAFEATFAEDIDRIVARFPKLDAADLRQRLRIKLFVGTGTTPPRVRDYAGLGSLQGWVKVTAARAFVDVARSDLRLRYEAELDEIELLGLAAPGTGAGELAARAQLGGAVKRAFASAVAGLAPRERTFLRHASVDGLTLDQIAATYRVHRATVARALKAARERLIEETRAGVIAELGLSGDDLGDVLGSLDSKLDLSLARVLRTERGE